MDLSKLDLPKLQAVVDGPLNLKTMKLPDLLTQITPLETDSEQPLTKAYVKHASAHFPELVKALEDLVNDGECYCADEMKTSCGHCLAKELLARANEIKI